MEREEETSTPGGVPRRAVLRSVVWSTPVVLAAAAAPAMAASVGPLTVTATRNLFVLQMMLTFTGGQSNLPVTIVSVTTPFLGQTRTIAMSPAGGISSVGGTSNGALLSAFLTFTYTVVYIFNGQTYTTVVAA